MRNPQLVLFRTSLGPADDLNFSASACTQRTAQSRINDPISPRKVKGIP